MIDQKANSCYNIYNKCNHRLRNGVTDMQSIIWLALGYNVPANPSKNRVYVWRKLKEMGAGYFRPGVALLPKHPQSMAQFRGLAAKIRDMGGDASIVEMRFCDPRDEAETIERFRSQSEIEYRELIRDCADLLENIHKNLFPDDQRSEQVKRVIRRYGKARARDYFKAGSRSALASTLDELAEDIGDLGKQIRGILEEI